MITYQHTCCDCFGDGWGPMLRTVVWELIAPEVLTLYTFREEPDEVHWVSFCANHVWLNE